MVQLPEKTDNNSTAFKDGLGTICDIGKARIKRAIEIINSEKLEANADLGFRVRKLDETNMRDVYYSADDYNQGMLAMLESNIKDDRTDLDLLFGCLLEWGFRCRCRIRQR